MENMMLLVEVKEYAFLPTHLHWVFPGDDLLFWNSGNQVYKIVGEGVESPDLLPDMFWQFKVTEAREYNFKCDNHDNMTFTADVRPMPEPTGD